MSILIDTLRLKKISIGLSVLLSCAIITANLTAQKPLLTKAQLGTTITNFPSPLDDLSFPFSPVIIDEHTPEWARLLYLPNPNLFEIGKLYEQWREENPEARGDHVRNYRKLKGYVFLNDAINDEGYIDIPSDKEIKQINKKILYDRQTENLTKSASNNNITWQFKGPHFMKSTTGKGLNRHINIYSITQSLSNHNILYCTSEDGGTVFKTIDNGDNWYSVSDELITSMGSRNIEVAPSDPDIVYLCTKHDIYKTIAGGNTWTSIYNENNSDNRTLIIHPTDPDTILAGGSKGILKSTDGGATWSNPLPEKSVFDIRYKPGSTSIIYALVGNSNLNYTEFYKSTDGGESWTIRQTGWPSEASEGNIGGQMTTSDGNPNIIFAFIGAIWIDSNNTTNIKILKSSNSGETWTTKVDYDNAKNINSGQGYYDWDIEMSDVDSNIVAFGTQSSWISYDGLETVTKDMRHGWSGHADIQEMLFNGTEIWVANDGGVIKYDNDSLYNWVAKSQGINAISYWGYDHGWNEDVGCGVHYHNGTSATHENYEANIGINFGGAEPHFALVSQPNGDKIVSKGYGSVNGYTMPDQQDGQYKRFSYNLTPNNDYIIGNNGATHPAYYNTQYQPKDNKLLKTTDFGITWDTVYTFPLVDDFIWDVRMTRANLDVIFVTTLRSSNVGGANVYKSVDGGNTFNQLSLPSWFDVNPKIINIAVSNEDENTFFLMCKRWGTKVMKTTDGGATWTNLGSSTIDGYGGSKIMLIDGTDGGIYLVAGRGIFYRNNHLQDWQLVTEGLPANASSRFIQPFYRDGEVRLPTNRGVYGAKLYNTPQLSDALVQPSVDKQIAYCVRDTFYFDDYSIVEHEGTSWSWSFPGAIYVSNENIRNPKVLYNSNGSYDVILNITKNGTTYSKTMTQMIEINDYCLNIDSIPDKAITVTGSPQHVVTEDFNLTTNTFSFTGWVKPKGSLEPFTGIFSNGVWCAHCNEETLGLEINYWGGHLWYRWPGSTSGWASRTTLAPIVDEWNFIAMVMSPDSVIVYLNDEKWVSQISHKPADIGQLYFGKGFYSRYLNGEIDEYTFWKKSLSEKEVRELMHLTKDPIHLPDLIAYYQFNDTTDNINDKAATKHAYLQNGASQIISTVPIGKGTSSSMTEESNLLAFNSENVKIAPISQNNTEIVTSRIATQPYNIPKGFDSVYSQQYWAIHRYSEDTFNGKITFKLTEDITPIAAESFKNFVLLSRQANSDGDWAVVDTASIVDASSDEITFDSISTLGQFMVANTGIIKPVCMSLVRYENRNDLPDVTGSATYIEAGNINGSGDVFIMTDQNKTFRASDYINLLPGFIIEEGALFEARIESCVQEE